MPFGSARIVPSLVSCFTVTLRSAAPGVVVPLVAGFAVVAGGFVPYPPAELLPLSSPQAARMPPKAMSARATVARRRPGWVPMVGLLGWRRVVDAPTSTGV